jgi:serine phosphatase RsbU (regulator of sigma subunit)
MKRYAPFAACIAGTIVIILLLPRFNAAQPRGLALTRNDARAIAKRAARDVGVPVDQAWETVTWRSSFLLSKELRGQPQRRPAALADPVLGPRLDSYFIHFYRTTKEKGNGYGWVFVNGRNGDVVGARRFYRDEESGPHLTEAQLRPRADAFVHSRSFPGAPSPQFESARSTVIRNRTDWVFRYRVASNFFGNKVVPYLYVYFAGNRFAGWELREEYADGHPFEFDDSDVGVILGRFIVLFAMLIALLVIFLKKYHAGEVGVGTASMLFVIVLALMLVSDIMSGASMSEGTGIGLDAPTTAWAMMAFKFVLLDLPLALVVFLGWSVGESYARERWGERLASLDAILRRDPFNATVGRSLLRGALTAPAVAACAMLAGLVALVLHKAWPSMGATQYAAYYFNPSLIDVYAASDAIVVPVVGILFVLAWAHRRRVLWLGILVAIALGVIAGATELPIQPWQITCLFGFGGIAACLVVFLAYDLLSTAVALFGASIMLWSLPLLSVARGHMLTQASIASITPLVVIVGFAVAALMTRREVVYAYEDLAPHVKRIVERERVKAEIDAANRIQAALLPLDAPQLAGASVASHYRAATEIGGDYFDFLTLRDGDIGIAFGDVSGHGLTSGIVMAMAKSALLVQVEVDPSPRAVMNVLNDIVMKTAPKRIMMTFFFGVLDPATQQVRFSSAGHLDPYVYRAARGELEALSSWGFPLGVRRRDPFREHVVVFAPGDRLILYSDGLIEALDDDGNPFGFDRFEQVLRDCGARSAEEIKNALLKSIRKFTRNRPPEDDQTLVVVSFEEEVAGEAIA